MKIRRFYGKDMREALKQVKDELGSDAVIMSNKKLADGVEIVAAYDNEPVKPQVQAKPDTVRPSQIKRPTMRHPLENEPISRKAPTTLSEIIGDTGPDSLRALLDKQSAENNGHSNELQSEDSAPSFVDEIELEQAPTLRSNASEMQDIREELRSLRDVLEFQVSGILNQQTHQRNPLQSYMTHRLEAMGISSDLAEEVVSYIPENMNERDSWLFLLKLLANRIKTGHNDILGQRGVVALLGPTGTGKTTTIAKLAAKYAQVHGADKVALITTDTYRIAAYEQLATYGKIIGCVVKKADDAQTLSDLLYQFRSKTLVLIDTAGFSQRDIRLIKQLDTLDKANCANIKKYLVLQANTQYRVLSSTLKNYEKISLQGCIFTKLDECYSLGELVSVAAESGLPVSYVTNGQKVPEDLKVANAKELISMSAKLYKKYAVPKQTRSQMVRAALV